MNLINLSLITVHLFNCCVRRRGLRGYEPRDCFAYSVFEVAWTYRVGQGLTLFPLGKSRASMVLSCPSSNFLMPMFTHPGWIFPSMVPVVQYLFTLVTPLCSFHSWKIHRPFLSMVINYEADNMYTTRIKPFLPTFQQLINPSCVVLISLFLSREMYHLSPDIKGECPAIP